MPASPTRLDRLFRERGSVQRTLARRIVGAGVPWEAWEAGFKRTYLREPARAERAAHALEVAARAANDADGAARFLAWRGIALQRSGSPAQAAAFLIEAEEGLREAGEHDRAASALALAVDALGHAGQVEAALRAADRARKRIRGPRAPLWRAILQGNRANVLRLAGRLEESARASDASARAMERLGHAEGAAAPRLNAGVALMYAGHVDRARQRFEAARDTFEAAGHEDRALVARYNLACLDVRNGALGEGIRTLETLTTRFRSLGHRRDEALCHMDLSDGLRRAGDTRTAAEEAQAAARLFAKEGALAEEVEALWLAVVAAAENDGRKADSALERAQARSKELGRPELELRCELLAHDLVLRRGGRLDGRALLSLEVRARRLGQQEVAAEAGLLRATAARTRGDRRGAARALDALPLVARRQPWLRMAAESLRARVEVDARDVTRALRRLRGIAARLDRIRLGLPGAWLRTTFLFEQLDPYLTLVDVLLERGRPADRREAEQILDALALRRFLQGRTPDGVARRVTARRRRLERLYDRLAEGAGPTRGLNVAQRGALLDEVQQLEREIADVWRRSERRDPKAHTHGNGTAGTPSDAVAVHVWMRSGAIRALCRRGDVVDDVRVLTTRAQLEKAVRELGFHAQRVRLTGSPRAVAAFDDALARLGAKLLGPLETLRPGDTVRLILDARLPDVPWELLPMGGRPFAVACRMARAPAARLPTGKAPAARGTTVVAAGERELPGVWREALHVGRGARLVHGASATRGAVADALRTRRVVHLAMHGVEAPDAPALGGLRLADGWFTAADVPESVGAEVVSLAACRTGAPPGAAAQAWGALPTTLMRAGSAWVLWTSGDVDDETTADFMSGFHPVRDPARVPHYFGRAIERVHGAQGTLARLLPFRLSGGRP